MGLSNNQTPYLLRSPVALLSYPFDHKQQHVLINPCNKVHDPFFEVTYQIEENRHQVRFHLENRVRVWEDMHESNEPTIL